MMTALYVFIGVLAAALVIYIFDRFAGFVRKIKRKLDAPPRTPYYGFYGMYGPDYYGLNAKRLANIQNKLDDLENKIDQLLEDTGELMLAKERPEE